MLAYSRVNSELPKADLIIPEGIIRSISPVPDILLLKFRKEWDYLTFNC